MLKLPFFSSDLRREARILIQTSLITFFAWGLLGPIYAIFVERIGGDILDAGIAYAIFSCATGLFVLFFGTSQFFAKNVRLMLVLGYLLFFIGTAGYLIVRTPIQLFWVQMVLGVAYGILEPSFDSVFAADLSEAEASRHWSIWTGGTSIVTGIAALAGSAIVAAYSFTVLFTVMSVLSFAGLMAVLRILKIPDGAGAARTERP